ncbi:NAD(P)H-dependent oxidoreductase [Pedobacter aquatilis]|uniref:NAD(P)H-dependent oxidoreductase n=1 Tax=Pedobacter aquatilis TaxID=351343 RepID=UPI00292CB858|nr:NAD(P)H-dependent oxidoreductase [Pedobacter aquatilis]
MKNNVLIISGHPNLNQSFANRAVLNEVEKLAPDFKIRDLGSLYPDFMIDIQAEQDALVEADVIVWQFPVQWFTAPAIFKKWQDDVLVYGFAYGSTGKYLKDKKVILSVTVGGEEHEYATDSTYKHTVEEFMLPQIASIPYCNMDYAGLVYSADMTYVEGAFEAEKLKKVELKAVKHAHALIELIKTRIL